MKDELRIYCDVDDGFARNHLQNLLGKIEDRFGGQMVVIIARGVPRSERTIKAWYFSGIIPDFIGVLRAMGYQVDPKDSEQRKETHRLFKSKYLSPLTDDFGNLVDLDGRPSVNPIYTTRNLGRSGWIQYVNDILSGIEREYGVILKPKKQVKK